MTIRGIATAPVSFGVYGAATRDSIDPAGLLDAAVAAGYSGMELGPPGFFGSPDDTARAFEDRGLVIVAAYVPVHLTAGDDTVAHDLARMELTLAELRSAARPGLALLADEGSPELLQHPARGDGHPLALDDRAWGRLVLNLSRAMELADRAGVGTSFHPHVSTYIESPGEIERLLSSTTVSLTLDSGHFWLAGADPVEHLARYRDRIDHVHLKDVRGSVLAAARARGATDFDAWWGDISTPLGEGDVDLDRFVASLHDGGYHGWIVIEQDRLPLASDATAQVIAEQTRNRRWLESVLARCGGAIGVGAT